MGNSPHQLHNDANGHLNNAQNETPYSPIPIHSSDQGLNIVDSQNNNTDFCQRDNVDNVDNQIVLNGQCTGEIDISQLVPAEVGEEKIDDIDLRLHKKRKKKKKKRDKAEKDENSDVLIKDDSENAQKLTLKIQKLIVRKNTDNTVIKVHEAPTSEKYPSTQVNNFKQDMTLVEVADESIPKLNGETLDFSNLVDPLLGCSEAQKRLRNDAKSQSSEEETLEQVQKRKRDASSPSNNLGGEPMDVDSAACRRKSKKSSKRQEQNASDDDVVMTYEKTDRNQSYVNDFAVRPSRKKTVNYKEAKSGSEPEVSESEKHTKTKKKKKKRKKKRGGS